MKPITKKILESGLVDKHTAALMERWGVGLERGASDLVGKEDLRKASAETLTSFASELEELLDNEDETLRESRNPIEVESWAALKDVASKQLFTAPVDRSLSYIFPPTITPEMLTPGRIYEDQNEDRLEVLEHTDLYVDETLFAFQVRMRKL